MSMTSYLRMSPPLDYAAPWWEQEREADRG
jgi:hypothetical protein